MTIAHIYKNLQFALNTTASYNTKSHKIKRRANNKVISNTECKTFYFCSTIWRPSAGMPHEKAVCHRHRYPKHCGAQPHRSAQPKSGSMTSSETSSSEILLSQILPSQWSSKSDTVYLMVFPSLLAYNGRYSGGVRVFAAPANVCVTAPTYQISSAIRVFFRISDIEV